MALRSFAALVRRPGTRIAAVALVSLLGACAGQQPQTLTVAVSLDIPPYVMSKATRGVEVEILQKALPGYQVSRVQMDYEALESAVSDKKADVAMSVQTEQPGVSYSQEYIGFVNFAISKASDHFLITSVADLKGHTVLTWDNAWTELGDAFKQQYAPESAERANYVEVADQEQQVRQFWEGDGRVIVIDRSIFDYFSLEQGHSVNEAEYHALFPEVTRFKVGFADAAVRDAFDAGLKALCSNGEYGALLQQYEMPATANVCGG